MNYARGMNPKSWGNHKSGADCPRWSDDKIISSHGYVKLRVGVEHPLADPNGYAYEHLVVWIAAGNQRPTAHQLLHHKNENKTDNRLGNLELITRLEHARKHHSMVPDDSVRQIRERYATGEDGTALALEFGVPIARVYRWLHGESRRSAGGPVHEGNLRPKAAGRTLDGVVHDAFPQVSS